MSGTGTVVADAIAALSAFGGDLNRDQALGLLSYWARRGELSAADVRLVVSHFRLPHQFCRVGVHDCTPAVTLTFNGGVGRLHWCAEHAPDAERYRPASDQAAGGVR